MQIDKITDPYFTSKNNTLQNQQPKFDLLSKFHECTKNSADMTDTIVVPRTIFKGYLGIMTGTTLITLGSILNKSPKISKSLSIAGLLTSLYGTWAFVRPFIIKDSKGVATNKNEETKE